MLGHVQNELSISPMSRVCGTGTVYVLWEVQFSSCFINKGDL